MTAEKNQELTLDIIIFMGTGLNSPHFLIHHEPSYKLKKFAMFKHIGGDQRLLVSKPDSQVMFVVKNVETKHLLDWLALSFILESDRSNPGRPQVNYT